SFKMRTYSDLATPGGAVAVGTTSTFNGLLISGVTGAHVVSVGINQQTGADVSIGTPNANNIRLDQGLVTLDDPTGPAVHAGRADGGSGTITASALTFSAGANDPESSISREVYSLDGAPAVGAGLDDGCDDVFVCGAERDVSFTVPLGGLSDGM